MATIRVAIRFSWILGCALLDLLFFPFRMAAFLLFGDSHRREILRDLGQALAPEESDRRSKRAVRKVFLSVGDVSAEPHALRLMEAMRKIDPSIEFSGFGGSRMEAAGCKLLFNPVNLALFGFSGPAKQVPAHLGALWRFLRLMETDRPDLVVLLDYPGFNLYLAKAARERVPVDYYICPQIWAWAPWRLRSFRRSVGRALSILPFETAYFRRQGIDARFVGHPIADTLEEADRKLGVRKPEKSRVLAILPGSRSREIALNLPAMFRIAEGMRKKDPEIRCVVPHDREDRIEQIREIAGRAPFPVEIRPGRLHETLQESRLALVKSGTSILEVGHFELPMIVFYKFPSGLGGRFREWMRRRFLIPPWFASLNLLSNREMIPEFAYGEEAAESAILDKAISLWEDGREREACIASLREVRRLYDAPGTASRAAAALLAGNPG